MTVHSSPTAERIGPGATTAPKHLAAQVSAVPALTAVRVSGHPDFDRITLDVDGGLPGFDVRYVPQLTADGTDEPVAVRGRAFLDVGVLPASTFTDDPSAFALPPVADVAALRGTALTGDWEGVLSLGIGVCSRLPFLVRRLVSPPRIVIDVAHALPGAGHQVLRRGDRSAAVATWQWRLRLALPRDLAVDEHFGPLTEAATRDFQRSHGLTPNGLAGRRSRAAMEHALGL